MVYYDKNRYLSKCKLDDSIQIGNVTMYALGKNKIMYIISSPGIYYGAQRLYMQHLYFALNYLRGESDKDCLFLLLTFKLVNLN